MDPSTPSSFPFAHYYYHYYVWTTALGIVIPLIVTLLRCIFYPAWVSAKVPMEYTEEVLLPIVEAAGQTPTVVLSIVIPAYNEESRLLSMMETTLTFIEKEKERICSKLLLHHPQDEILVQGNDSTDKDISSCYYLEFVIVDDGSTDRTYSVIKEEILPRLINHGTTSSKGNCSYSFKVLQLQKNRGKGAAVKIGVLHSTGRYILMADADGATDITDLLKLITAMNEILQEQQQQVNVTSSSSPPQKLLGVAFGSRAHLQDTAAVVQRSPVRTLLMWAFHMCVAILCSRRIRDTQCGFKLFTADAAKLLFSNLHLQRWAFDIELVTIAESLQIPIAEVGVQWNEVDGSKLDTGSKWRLLVTSVGMLRDMICVRLCYTLGVWRLRRV